MSSRKNIEAADEILEKYFPVLDYGFVSLVDYMGGDDSLEKYARVSYGSKTRKVSDTRGLIRYLIRHFHTTPIESTELAFHIGLPIHVARQLVRHRTFSPINEYSGRYSVMPDIFYTPAQENFSPQSKNNKQGRSDTSLDGDKYDYFIKEIQELRNNSSNLYHKMLDDGVAREIARMDLPLSTYTYWYCKMDLGNLFKLLKLRLDPHAQWEIRQYAKVIAGMVKRVAPIAFEAFCDYSFYADPLTKLDKKFLEFLVKEFNFDSFDAVKNIYEGSGCVEHKKIGFSDREIEEFWKKLVIPESLDFDLKIEDSKSPEYFENIIKENSK